MVRCARYCSKMYLVKSSQGPSMTKTCSNNKKRPRKDEMASLSYANRVVPFLQKVNRQERNNTTKKQAQLMEHFSAQPEGYELTL